MTESQHGMEASGRSASVPGEGVWRDLVQKLEALVHQASHQSWEGAEPEHEEKPGGTGESPGWSRGAQLLSKPSEALGPVRRDDAYYDEVRRAVGRGAPSLLFGTSTKSLERSLAKLRNVETKASSTDPVRARDKLDATAELESRQELGDQAPHHGRPASASTGRSEETPTSDVRYLTVAEVATIMRVSKMTVYKLVHDGELESIRVGRSFRVPETVVNRYLRDEASLRGSGID